MKNCYGWKERQESFLFINGATISDKNIQFRLFEHRGQYFYFDFCHLNANSRHDWKKCKHNFFRCDELCVCKFYIFIWNFWRESNLNGGLKNLNKSDRNKNERKTCLFGVKHIHTISIDWSLQTCFMWHISCFPLRYTKKTPWFFRRQRRRRRTLATRIPDSFAI